MRKHYITFLFLIFCLNIFSQQPGDLDVDFGQNGKVQTNFGDAAFNVKSQALQSDGKLIVVGEIDTGLKLLGFIMRLNSDGSLDNTFNTSGRIIHPFLEGINVVKIQPDGKIVVGSSYNSEIAIARYNTDGSPDLGFAIDGTFYYSGAPSQYGRSVIDMELQSTGKIVVLTIDTPDNLEQDIVLYRFNANGIFDSTFGTDGEVLFDVEHRDMPKAISIQTDDKIVVGGDYRTLTNDSNIFVLKCNSDGALDTTFNTTGYRIFGFSSSTSDNLHDLDLQTDNKIVLTGRFYNAADYLYVIRMNTDGSYDTSFSTDGLATVSFDMDIRFDAKVKVQPDGKVLVLSTEENATSPYYTADMVLIRFDVNGNLDTTFDVDGAAFISHYSYDDIGSGILFLNNKIIVIGNTDEFFYKDKIAITQVNLTDGSLDTALNGTGKFSFKSYYEAQDYIVDTVILSDGKILNLGIVYANDNYYPSLVKYNVDGTIDTTFGDNGKIIYYLTAGELNAIEIDNNGKILLGGTDLGTGFILVRINQDGTLDSSFGTGGLANLSISGTFGGQINDIKVLADDKIIVAGRNFPENNNSDFTLLKLNNDGTLDNSFGVDGVSDFGSSNLDETLVSIEVLSDNKIIALAYVSDSTGDYQAEILKFNSIGLLDPTFNSNGRFYTNKVVDYYSSGDIEIQSDNKVLATFETNQTNNSFLLYRLSTDGTLDVDFNGTGLVEMYVEGNDNSSEIYYDATTQKIVLIGTSNATDRNFAMIRFENDGLLDATFGNSGIVITDFNATENLAVAVTVANDGKLVISGALYDENEQIEDHIMAKYHLTAVLSANGFEKNNFTLYPNPTSDYINIKSTDKLLNMTYEIFDISGKLISFGQLENNKINVTNLLEGNYILVFDNKESFKFIKN